LADKAALEDVQTIRIHSHGILDLPSRGISGVPFKAEVVFRRPDRIRLDWEFPEQFGGNFSFGFDGNDAWGIFGAPPARCQGWHRQMVLHMVGELQMYLVAPAREEYGGSFAIDPAASTGSRIQVVYRPFGAESPWNAVFNRETGDLVRLEHKSFQMDGEEIDGRIIRSAFKQFGVLRYASRAKFEALRDGNVVETAEETIDTFEVNPSLASEFFACPRWEVDTASIGTKEVPAQTVVTFVHRGPYCDIGKSLAPAMDVIFASDLVPNGAAWGTYLNDPANVPTEDLRTELAVRVSKMKETDPDLPSGYEFATVPAKRVAYAYHRGDHADEGEAHERLRAWMTGEGLSPMGPPQAIWYHDPEVTLTEDLVTEVQIPVDEIRRDQIGEVAFNPLPLDDEWTRWIVGEWVGTGESAAGTGRGTVRVELALNGQFLIFTGEGEVTDVSTEQLEFLKKQLHASHEEIQRFKDSPFQSLELYTIDQKTGDVLGYMFDSLRCIATGRGHQQDGKQVMQWQWASGHTSTRTTERISDDRFAVIEEIAMPDGSTMEERGEMLRRK
jgi:DNA gyrase inhibitor GyrI